MTDLSVSKAAPFRHFMMDVPHIVDWPDLPENIREATDGVMSRTTTGESCTTRLSVIRPADDTVQQPGDNKE